MLYYKQTCNATGGRKMGFEMKANAVNQIPKGTEIDVLAVCGNWGYVKYDGYYGWLSMDYIKAK
jgi:hypothetical protein